MVNGINAFLPGSLVDTRPLRDTSHLDDQDLELKIVKLDEKSNNIVVSRRAILEEANSEERDKLLEQMEEGATFKGIVKNLTDYGAFIDLGGIDGLLHITDISWKRIKHPSEILNVGDEIDVKVLRYDQERKRVSLGMKQLASDPWTTAIENYAVGQRVTAKVTKLADTAVLHRSVRAWKVSFTSLKWIGLTATFTHLKLFRLVMRLKFRFSISINSAAVSLWALNSVVKIRGMPLHRQRTKGTRFLVRFVRSLTSVSLLV